MLVYQRFEATKWWSRWTGFMEGPFNFWVSPRAPEAHNPLPVPCLSPLASNVRTLQASARVCIRWWWEILERYITPPISAWWYAIIYLWAYKYTYICIYVCAYVCVYIYIYMYVCMYVCMYVYMYVCIYICVCVYPSCPMFHRKIPMLVGQIAERRDSLRRKLGRVDTLPALLRPRPTTSRRDTAVSLLFTLRTAVSLHLSEMG